MMCEIHTYGDPHGFPTKRSSSIDDSLGYLRMDLHIWELRLKDCGGVLEDKYDFSLYILPILL